MASETHDFFLEKHFEHNLTLSDFDLSKNFATVALS